MIFLVSYIVHIGGQDAYGTEELDATEAGQAMQMLAARLKGRGGINFRVTRWRRKRVKSHEGVNA